VEASRKASVAIRFGDTVLDAVLIACGATIVNIGTGPSNARNITADRAAQPERWITTRAGGYSGRKPFPCRRPWMGAVAKQTQHVGEGAV
jgi:hypothetical protein